MDLNETVDYLAEKLDLERSDSVREVGQSVVISGTNDRLSLPIL